MLNSLKTYDLIITDTIKNYYNDILQLLFFCKEYNLKEKNIFEKNAFKTINLNYLVAGKQIAELIYNILLTDNQPTIVIANTLKNHDIKSFYIVEYDEDGYEEANYNENKDSFFLVLPLIKGSKQIEFYPNNRISSSLIFSFKDIKKGFCHPAGYARKINLTDKKTKDIVAFFHFVYNPKKNMTNPKKEIKKKHRFKDFIKKLFKLSQ